MSEGGKTGAVFAASARKATATASTPGGILYERLADWWPLLSPPERYLADAAAIKRLLRVRKACRGRTLLLLAGGGGCLANALSRHYRVTVVDRSAGMIAVSRRLNPELRHVVGDIREVDLGEAFPAVVVDDGVSHVSERRDLEAVMRTAWRHCRPGGVAVFLPEYTAETFHPSLYASGAERENGSIRYMCWTYPSQPSDERYVSWYAFMVREGGEEALMEERFVCGLFGRQVWLQALQDVGFQAELVPDRGQTHQRGDIFVGVRAPDAT